MCLKFQRNWNTPCLLATHGSTPYIYKGTKPRRERKGTFLISDLCFWLLYTSMSVHSNLLLVHVHFKLCLASICFLMSLTEFIQPWKYLAPSCYLSGPPLYFYSCNVFRTSRLMGNQSFLPFPLFCLQFRFPLLLQCFTAVAEFFFASVEVDVIAVKASFKLLQGAEQEKRLGCWPK